ncbi:MAG: hypothetical protein RIM23_10370 [Coleofasciculus sp. G3-WIS-01]|uniref:hypothetical protein n=1 Tax=Coleofasciculus sp. G3-WIS-01 TaxID=3069528 RepID=UPI0032F22D75
MIFPLVETFRWNVLVLVLVERLGVDGTFWCWRNGWVLGYSTLRVLLRSTRRLRLRSSTQPTGVAHLN